MISRLLLVDGIFLAGLIPLMLYSGASAISNVVFGATVLFTSSAAVLLTNRLGRQTLRGLSAMAALVLLSALVFMGSAVALSAKYEPSLVYFAANVVLSVLIAVLAVALSRLADIVQRRVQRNR